jgi:multidrug transporter EmrE-like cation transporter
MGMLRSAYDFHHVLYFLLTLVFSLGGQVLLKAGVMDVLDGQRPGLLRFVRSHLWEVLLSGKALLGIVLCGLGLVCWLYVLSVYDLSRALPILGGLGYIVIFFVGRFILHEEVSWLNFGGILAVIVGLYLIMLKEA